MWKLYDGSSDRSQANDLSGEIDPEELVRVAMARQVTTGSRL